jgi:hypothetical protein
MVRKQFFEYREKEGEGAYRPSPSFFSLSLNHMLEIRLLDFSLGLAAGLILGFGLVFLVIKVRSWLGKSPVGRLTMENRELKRRLAEKDRHVSRMLQETERLAEKLAQGKAPETTQGGT